MLPNNGGMVQGLGAGWLGVWGQGTFHPPCHILHYHMVLRPEGTSPNKSSEIRKCASFDGEWTNPPFHQMERGID